ncbi:MAG TPA: VCBS repeat-containing protein, partial [Edaphobacter sp.]|nr:VCBS repeat-containing protein [Edaphobacter sp.]
MRLQSRVTVYPALIMLLFAVGCKQKQSSKPAQSEPSAVNRSVQSVRVSKDAVSTPARPSGPIQFTDVTAQAGIHFKRNSGAFGKKYLPETMGSGVCVLDYDNDGWQDILFVNSMEWPGHKSTKSYPALYHNNHDGTFTDVTRQAGLATEMYGLGCAAADYDNDGFEDIYITALDGNYLFHN